jgi:uncharacterized protein YciI
MMLFLNYQINNRNIMSTFLYKLIPPRPTFPADATEAEGAVMQEHFTYWSKIIEEGKAVVYGPVMDPKGTYGIAVIHADDEETAKSIAENDPAVTSKAGFSFELHPMPDAIVKN